MWAPGVLTFFFYTFFFVSSRALSIPFNRRAVAAFDLTPSQWIWTNNESTDPHFASLDVYAFRKTYISAKVLKSAVLLLCSDDISSTLQVNGNTISPTVHTVVQGCSGVLQFEVASQSLSGKSIIFDVQTRSSGILAAIKITMNDGTTDLVTSDATWQAELLVPGDDSEDNWSSAVVGPQTSRPLFVAPSTTASSTTTVSSKLSTTPVSTKSRSSTMTTILTSSTSSDSSSSSFSTESTSTAPSYTETTPIISTRTTGVAEAAQSAPPFPPPPVSGAVKTNSSISKTVIGAVVGGTIFGLVVVGVLVYIGLLFYRKNKGPDPEAYVDIEAPENPYAGPRFVVEPFKLYQADITSKRSVTRVPPPKE